MTNPTWISDRLKMMARMKRTRPPNDLTAIASALTGFEQSTIDDVCGTIEREDKAGFPRLGRLLNECRVNAAKHHTSGKNTHWSLDRYKQCRDFDDWLHSEVKEHGKNLNELIASHLHEARAWTAWREQKIAGTLHCPGWCDVCEGNGFTVSEEEDGERYAKPCERCRR
jgi:hypothetical protein